MDYNEIENLVLLAKIGDKKAKEDLMVEFTPLILNLSKNAYVNSYEFADIKNECYQTLFKCVNVYDSDKHRFVSYATNAIKNSVNLLIRVSIRRNTSEGPGAFILDEKLENTLYSDLEDPSNFLLSRFYKTNLKAGFKNLNSREQELVTFVYFEKHSLKKFSEFKSIPYATAVTMRNEILYKLKKYLNKPENTNNYIN